MVRRKHQKRKRIYKVLTQRLAIPEELRGCLARGLPPGDEGYCWVWLRRDADELVRLDGLAGGTATIEPLTAEARGWSGWELVDSGEARFGEWLKLCLTMLDMSVEDFSRACRTSLRTAYRWISGTGAPRPNQLPKIRWQLSYIANRQGIALPEQEAVPEVAEQETRKEEVKNALPPLVPDAEWKPEVGAGLAGLPRQAPPPEGDGLEPGGVPGVPGQDGGLSAADIFGPAPGDNLAADDPGVPAGEAADGETEPLPGGAGEGPGTEPEPAVGEAAAD